MSIEETLKDLIHGGDLPNAVDAAMTAVVQGGASDEVLRLGAQAAYKIGADSPALELFTRLDVRTSMDATELAMMGHAADRQGRYPLAISAYRRALGINSKNPAVQFNLGTVYLRRYQWSDAIRHLEIACELQSDWVSAYTNLGQALLGTENYATCVSYYRECMDRFPDEIGFHECLAETFMRRGDRDAAESEFRAILKREKSNAEAWTGLITAVVQDERFDEAMRMIPEAREAEAWSSALTELDASLKQEIGDYENSIRLYETVLQREPDNRRAGVNLIEALLADGQAEKALKICDGRLAEFPGDAEMLAYKALVLIDMGRIEDSVALLPPEYVMPYRPVCPDGFGSMREFNQAMIDHILKHPSLELSPPNHATVSGRHTGSLVCEPWGPMRHFTQMIDAGATEYKNRLLNENHPSFSRWNDDYSLTVWAVEMQEGGHQMPHIHPSGYLSGVYYPLLPDEVQNPDDMEGFIEFFSAPEQFNLRHPEPVEIFPPQEGVMFLFPSCYFHRTIPFKGGGTRISVAFDLVPF